MIIYFSNRNIASSRAKTIEKVFGDAFNKGGSDSLRMCLSEPPEDGSDKWSVELIDAGKERQALKSVRKRIEAGELQRKWLVFLHGNNQGFDDNIRKCQCLSDAYGVNVIAFSWPSHPAVSGEVLLKGFQQLNFSAAIVAAVAANISLVLGGALFRKYAAYVRSRCNAYDSREAFGDCLRYVADDLQAKLADGKKLNLNFMSYSLGNYVLEWATRDAKLSGTEKLFKNVILCEADVNREGHEYWLEKLKLGTRRYVTHNEYDSVLALSDIYNKDRLGNSPHFLPADNGVRYVDFSSGKDVKSTHPLFFINPDNNNSTKNRLCKNNLGKNQKVFDFFKAIFSGKVVFPDKSPKAATGFMYNKAASTYCLRDKEPYLEPSDDVEA
ncbi:alpha/beta hydrolase [Sulfuriflexus mobilis]|uniref:alpha/beta hydrolase n=1 Tax=Sulfuriflexus mobilis TaxID=1811807 RepID=UPI000F8161FE|nr:alpha/beta hydrolase [Sulfuriflexus mobilis]